MGSRCRWRIANCLTVPNSTGVANLYILVYCSSSTVFNSLSYRLDPIWQKGKFEVALKLNKVICVGNQMTSSAIWSNKHD